MSGRTDAEEYDAFISYSHAGDRPLAEALQRGLQQFAKPWFQRKAIRVFRDQASLSATPGLWPTLEQTLARSRYLVLIASPESSRSHWVNEEVRYWLSLGRRDRLLLVLSAGQLVWGRQDFDWDRTDALPPALEGAFDQEPLHVDFRWARGQSSVSRRDARFTEPLASLAAPIRGIPRDELIGDDLRQHRRTLRIARSAAATLLVLLLIAVATSVVAFNQRNRAEQQARIAMSRLLANESASVGPDGVDISLLLAAQAYAAEPDAPSSWGALAGAITRTPALVGYLSDSATATIALAAPKGNLLAVGDERGSVALWRPVTRERLRVLSSSRTDRVGTLAFSADGSRLMAGDDGGGYAVWDVGDGDLISSGTLAGAVHAVGLDAAGTRFAASDAEGLVFGRVGERPRRLSQPVGASAFQFGSDTLTAADGQGTTVTWQLGTGQKIAESHVGMGFPRVSAFSAGLALFAGAAAGNPPYIVETSSRSDVAVDVGNTEYSIQDMAFDASGSTLAVATSAGVALWDVASKKLKGPVLEGIPGSAVSVTVQDGGSVVAAVGERGVAVWNLNLQSALVQRLEPEGFSRVDEVVPAFRGAVSVAFSPDGEWLAWTARDSSTGNLSVVVRDLKRGRELPRLGQERVISFSPDGTQIATGNFNSNEAVVVTDLATRVSKQHSAVPWEASPRPSSNERDETVGPAGRVDNGRGLGASVPGDGVLALWNTARGQEISRIPLDVEPATVALTFNAEGDRLAITQAGGLAYLIDVDPDSWRTRACEMAARTLTKTERAGYLGAIELPDECP